MTNYIVIGVVAFVVIVVATTLFKKEGVKKSNCPSCRKSYGGSPRKCPHCGEALRWKE